MYKRLSILLILVLILFSKCDEENNEEENDNHGYGDEYNEQDRNNYFKDALKEYLIKHNLINSEELVQPEVVKEMLIKVFTGEKGEDLPKSMFKIINELSDIFVNIYYRERKKIKGKELYDLIDLNAIFAKMGQLMEETSLNEKEEENDFDPMDYVDKPTPGL